MSRRTRPSIFTIPKKSRTRRSRDQKGRTRPVQIGPCVFRRVAFIIYHSFTSDFSSNGAFTPEQDNDKTNVEPVHFYYAFHTRSDKPGVKGIIEMHRFNICLVVVLLWCESTITPLKFTTIDVGLAPRPRPPPQP